MIHKNELLEERHKAIIRKAEPYEKMIDEVIKEQYPETGIAELTRDNFKRADLKALLPFSDSDIIDYLTQRYLESGGWKFVYSYDNNDGPSIKIYPA